MALALGAVKWRPDCSEYFRELKRAAYDHQVEYRKKIHPAHMNSVIVTTMYATGDPVYKAWILDHK